jgi:hypothetical protein
MTMRTLGDVVDILTIEHPMQAMFEGKPRWVRRDALIVQLRDAVTASMSGGNGTAATAGRLPFDSDALEQYNRLKALVEDLERSHDLPENNLRAWYARTYADLDEQAERIYFGLWSHWAAVIEAKLTPPIVLELMDVHTKQPFPCPECGFDWYEQILNSGTIPGSDPPRRWYDREKRVALVGTYRPDGRGGLERSAVECGCCGWRITGNDIRGFAWDLEIGELVDTP